jgi:peptide/nickel transport system permease protein
MNAVAARARVGAGIRSNRLAAACLTVIVLFTLIAIAAPLLAPHDPNLVNLSAVNLGPSSQHLLGTDESGRDLLSRLMFGARTSLLGPLLVVLLAGSIGTAIALLAAWRGGVVDGAVASAIDIVFGFPGLLLAVGAVAVFGLGLTAPVIALGIAYTPYIGRVVRAVALRERRLPYVAALQAAGCSGPRIVRAHLLPNLLPVIAAQATIAFAYATIDLAAISFLGLGVQPPTADWGLMIAQGEAAVLAGHTAQAIYPGVALVLVVVCVTLLGRHISADAELLP